MAVIDASVYLALLHRNDPHHQAAVAWLAQSRGDRRQHLAPNVILAEVGAALSRGLDDSSLAEEAVAELHRSPLLTLIPLTNPLAGLAAHIAITHRVPGCDAIYVAVAERNQQPLVTFDRRKVAWARERITVITPQ